MGKVTTWSLEMSDPTALRRAPLPAGDLRLLRVARANPAYNRFLYSEVGRDWQWFDKLDWSDAQWRAWADREALHTWVLYEGGAPAGYFELEQQDAGNVEIAYFGLLPGYHGRGLGGWLLGECIARAWDLGARRVWVHTCSLDHPAALGNYRARGLRVFAEATRSTCC